MSDRDDKMVPLDRAKDASMAVTSNVAASTQTVTTGAKRVLERNPLGLALGALAAGFLIGLVVPMGEFEREKVGPFGETLTRQARDAASDLVTQGKTVVLAAVTTALKNPQGPQ